jgi:Phage protein Gp138 N-terminal domain
MTPTPPVIPLYLPTANPTLPDVLNALRTSIVVGMNCHAIGTVQSFYEAMPNGESNGLYCVTATLDYVQTTYQKLPNGTYQAVTEPYPLVIDAPVLMLGGGLTQVSVPVAKGDPCLILFNDRDLNNWFSGARNAPVATARAHSFADAIALVGFSRTPLQSSTHMLMTNGSAEVGVPSSGAAQVRIANQVTTLATALGSLITAIEGITVGPGSFNAGGTPVSGVSGALTSTTALEAARTLLNSLLE